MKVLFFEKNRQNGGNQRIMKTTTEKMDVDHSLERVPASERKGFLTMFMIMLGFTFFSASMWTGQTLAEGLDLNGFIGALLIGGFILGVYTSLLAYVGCKTGLTMDLLAQHSFGNIGSYIPSALISFTQIGWFGVGVAMFAIPVAKYVAPDLPWVPYVLIGIAGICMTSSAFIGIKALTIVSYVSVPLISILGIASMYLAVTGSDVSLIDKFGESQNMTMITGVGLVIGSFVSGGTATPNFARFAKTPMKAVITTAIAFFLGNSLMFCFGAISGVYVGGNDIFEVMIALNLGIFAIIVLGLNIWTTNDNALYTAGLGLSNITKIKKSPLVLASGFLGTVTAMWLYNNFVGWLNILNATLPPIGAILILGYYCNKEEYLKDSEIKRNFNWFAVTGVVLGAIVSIFTTFGIKSINSMVIASIIFLIGEAVTKNKSK